MRAQIEHPRAAEFATKVESCANRDDTEDIICAALVAAGMEQVAEAWVGPERMRAADDDIYVSPVRKTGTATRTVDAYGRPATRRA